MDKLNISVLFVDDEKILRTVYSKIIGSWVQEVYLAENGVEGIALYNKHKPDLVITDIKMPVMSGLDMTIMIRNQYPKARVIVLSAFSEANYLIRAIEVGIKNFLLKPVDNNRLLQAVTDQAAEIELENKLIEEETKRIKAEVELKHNEQVLQAVSEIAAHLLSVGYNPPSVEFCIQRLGIAARVSRVYLFENYNHEGLPFSRQTHEWTESGIVSQLDNENLIAVPHHDPSFKRWAETLGRHETIHGLVDDFPDVEKEVLVPQEIVSIIAIPVFVNDYWFGFIGFDDCVNRREWTSSEINTLMTAANLIGSAIHRSNIENQLHRFNAELESRVQQRTVSLQEEIQERKVAEAMLRQSEEKYRSIFENANDAIFLSINAQIQFINPRFYELTGYYPNQMIGKSFLEIVHPDFKETVYNNYKKRLTNDSEIQSYDILIISAGKKQKWVEIKSKSIIWEGSAGLLTFLTDIQDRKDFEHELKDLNINLEARVLEELKHREKQQELFMHKSKLESLGELSAGMAHEINQPLGGLSISLDNILDDISHDRLETNYLRGKINLMFNDIDRIKKIIDHVRMFSREQQTEQQQVFDITKVIDNSLLLVNKLFVNNQINLVVKINNSQVGAFGNPFRLEQVLLNLLSNSKYATDKKSNNYKGVFVKSIQMESSNSNTHHIIKVTDNGIGIPENIIGNVFDPFFTTKNANDGTGLGLSISYGIIRDMKGSIEVESVEGEYTIVTVKIPVYKDEYGRT